MMNNVIEIQAGDELSKVRKSKGLSLEDVGSVLNTDKGRISRIEQIKVNPTLNTLIQYAEACGYSLVLKFEKIE